MKVIIEIIETDDNILLLDPYFSRILWAHQPTIYHSRIVKLRGRLNTARNFHGSWMQSIAQLVADLPRTRVLMLPDS